MDGRRPSPALLVAVIALVVAFAGSAVALPGKNQVDKNDIKKGAVTKKAIKKGAVTTAALGDASVTTTKIAPHETAHLVGTPGEPAFGNGGDGDCIWENIPAAAGIGTAPVGFFKDQLGFVNLQGIAVAENGPGGDGVCDPSDPGESADGLVFTLPTGYAPANLQFSVTIGTPQFVVPRAGATFETLTLPPGSVYVLSTSALLEGFDYEPGTGAAARAEAPRLGMNELDRLMRP